MGAGTTDENKSYVAPCVEGNDCVRDAEDGAHRNQCEQLPPRGQPHRRSHMARSPAKIEAFMLSEPEDISHMPSLDSAMFCRFAGDVTCRQSASKPCPWNYGRTSGLPIAPSRPYPAARNRLSNLAPSSPHNRPQGRNVLMTQQGSTALMTSSPHTHSPTSDAPCPRFWSN